MRGAAAAAPGGNVVSFGTCATEDKCSMHPRQRRVWPDATAPSERLGIPSRANGHKDHRLDPLVSPIVSTHSSRQLCCAPPPRHLSQYRGVSHADRPPSLGRVMRRERACKPGGCEKAQESVNLDHSPPGINSNMPRVRPNLARTWPMLARNRPSCTRRHGDGLLARTRHRAGRLSCARPTLARNRP